MKTHLIALSLAAFVSACAPNLVTPPSVEAPRLIGEAFSTVDTKAPVTGDITQRDRVHLAIKKSALEKEFLLSAAYIPQGEAATGTGMASRVVAFRHVGKSVFLLEATEGHVVTHDLPTTLILGEMPVLEENEEELVIDFNSGMNRAFVQGGWAASDFEGRGYWDMARTFAINVTHSFIDRIENRANALQIRQIAQIDPNFGQTFPTLEMRYILKPYVVNEGFEYKEQGNFKDVAFFEIPPVLEPVSGRSSVRVTRFDTRKTVKFHVSANTPAEYVEATKEGIEYWNKAFGRNVVEAAMAPTGITAPDVEYNVVQWVPWDGAGFAYADMMADPRSGEALHGQAFMTSVFAFSSKARVRRLLRSLRAHEAKKAQAKAEGLEEHDHRHHGEVAKFLPRIGLKFLDSARLCNLDLSKQLIRTLETALAEDADEKTLLRISRDYVRGVVAHEVGHVLGLRHNFAGSLHANVTPKERDEIFKSYLLENKVPGDEKTFTSSVMDYHTFEDEVLVGAQIKNGSKAMDYDAKAIKWGYYNEEVKRGESPLFCTDSGTSFLDCRTWDVGASPLASLMNEMANSYNNMAVSLVERFISAKAPADPRDAIPLEEVNLFPGGNVGYSVAGLFAHLNENARTLFIERQFPFVGPLNKKEVRKARYEWLKSEINALGGVDRVFFQYLPVRVNWSKAATPKGVALPNLDTNHAMESLERYLEREDVRRFSGLDGKVHEFAPDELELIRERAKLYFAASEKEMLRRQLYVLKQLKITLETNVLGSLEEGSLMAQIERRLADVAKAVVMSQSNESPMITWRRTKEGLKPAVVVKRFRHDLELRKEATEILKKDLVPNVVDWSESSRRELAVALKGVVENTIGVKLESIKEGNLSRPLKQWYKDQKAIIDSLGGVPTTAVAPPPTVARK